MNQEQKNMSSVSVDPNGILEKVEKIKEYIWARRPILGHIMKKHGSRTLFEYARDFLDVNPNTALEPRKDELIKVAGELTEQRLGKEVADGVIRQLKKFSLVSTADHHSPIQHPFWVNANIISSIPYFNKADYDLRCLVVFSFASVSMNNSSGFPRGIEFHPGKKGTGKLVRLPILPDKLKMSVVYGTRSFTKDDIAKTFKALDKSIRDQETDPGIGEKIKEILEKYFNNEDVLSAHDFASQITKINYKLWPNFFHALNGSGIKCQKMANQLSVPDLIYLEIETLVRGLLLRFHLGRADSLLNQLIFNEKYNKLFLELFNNIPGAFSLEKNWGTYNFWAVDEKFHRVRLYYQKDKLTSVDNKIVIPLTPESISEGLRSRRIFPSMSLCYITVALYYGFKCLGGFCQVNDLTRTKEAWQNLLKQVGEEKEAMAIESVQTKELGGDGMVLAYLKTINGDLIPATGFDMIAVDGNTCFEKYVEFSKNLTLLEVMNPMLPEMYTVISTAEERDHSLASITPEQITHATKLNEKIKRNIT